MIGDQSSLTALYLTNPRAAQAMRRQQFGAQLAGGAMGGEPIQAPSQGIAKLAQALVGALLMNKGDNQMEEASAKQDEERQKFGSMLSNALMGSSGPVQEPMPQQQPMAATPAAGGGLSPDLLPHIQEASQRTGIPVPVLMAQIRQESGGNPAAVGDGGQSIGPMQVQMRTAAQPGYGVAPIDPAKLSDPRANINFGADYLAARGRAAGVQDWNDPAQRAKGLQAYNGGGDPNYVANVERYMPQGATIAQSSSQPPIPGNVEADLALAKRQQAVAMQMSQSSDPTIRHQADMLYRAAQSTEARALARMKILEGAQPDSPERHRQKLEVATAGKPSIENRVAIAGQSKAADLVSQRWDEMQATVRKGNQAEIQFQMFDKAMQGFDPGVGADIRQSALQALQELGFKNNAPQAELMKSIQRRLEFANTPKGEGSITENERALIREATNLFGSTPDGARLLMNATRELNAYDRRVLQIMTESAKRKGGAPDPVEVAEALQQLPPPLSPGLEEQIRGGVQSAKPPSGTPQAGAGQFSRQELEAELARRRAAR